MKKRILAFGEILWDILPDKTILGGAPFNFAYRLNSLGDEGLFVSSLGRDELGESALEHVRKLGMDTSLLQQNREFPTGTVDVSFDENHMPDYVINPGVAYDHIQLTEELLDAASNVNCLCFGTLIQRSEKSRQTLHALIEASVGAVRFLDINLRKDCYSRETIIYSLEKANILKLNDDEVFKLREILEIPGENFPRFCEFVINEFGLDRVLVTFGEKGAFARSAGGEEVYVPGYRIDLADSLGAGDAFSAAFVHTLLRGHSLKSACDLGNALGALVAGTHGATAVISESEITNFIESGAGREYHPEFFNP
jgi:fructokinase